MTWRLSEWLWTGHGQPPNEYLELVLCRDIYHCAPDVLRRQNLGTVLRHLECAKIEATLSKAKRRG